MRTKDGLYISESVKGCSLYCADVILRKNPAAVFKPPFDNLYKR